MYYVTDAIQVLKEYDCYANAEAEIKRKKISRVPYDMQGHYEVYCSYLSQIRNRIRDQLNRLQSINCTEWERFLDVKIKSHKECYLVYMGNSFCAAKCKYYQEKLKPLVEEQAKIEQIIRDLVSTAEKDRYMR